VPTRNAARAARRGKRTAAGASGASGPVGRDDVLAQLRRSVDDAVAGRGQVVLLTGEAGIGKTTMLTEAAQYAESRGARTAWGWGWPDEGAPGYWLWAQVTRALGLDALPGGGLLPGGGAPPPGSAATGVPAATGLPMAAAPAASAETDAAPASARFQLFDEVASRLLAESRIQPLTILLDDLQWADEPSLLLLDFLARRLPAGSAAVIGSYRDVGPVPGEVLERLSARSTVLPLAGLPAAAVTQLLARVAGDDQAASLGAEVHRRTGGNPFFVQQLSWLLKSGTGGLPPGIRQALDQRFAELTERCAAILSAAAVAGQRFTASLVASVTGEAADQVAAALGDAVQARVLAGDPPDGYRFAHDLFREFAAQRLAASARAQLHLRIGTALAAGLARGEEVSLAELAGHFVQADPGSRLARDYSAAAAREATGRLAYEEAVRHWERALAATGDAADDRLETLLELAEARRRAGAGQDAGRAFVRAAGLARSAGNAHGLARAALGLHAIGRRSWWPPDELVAVLSEALAALGDEAATDKAAAGDAAPGEAAAGDAAPGEAATGDAAPGETAAGDAGPGETALGEAGQGAAADAALRPQVMAALARVLAWHGRDLPRAQQLAQDAVAAARLAGDPGLVASCLLAQHNVIWRPGTAGERRALAAAVIELARDAGDAELVIEARLLAAADLMELADPAFRTELEEFLRLAGVSGQPRFRYAAMVRRATLALLAGRLAEAQRLIDQAAVLGEECGEPGAADVWGDQVFDLMAAQGRLGELVGVALEMFPDPDSRQARGVQAMALLAAGSRSQAAEVIAPALEDLTAPPANQQLLGEAAFAAQMAAEFGARPLAELLHAALMPYAGQAVVSGVVVTFRGAVAHHLGMLAAVLGRPAEAAGHLEHAIAVHERLGALPWTLRSRYELAGIWMQDPARRDAAVTTLAEVAAEAHRIGMLQLARDAEARGFAAGQTPVTSGELSRDGALWTLSYGGVTARMRHAKGLADLAVLLATPGRLVPAAELVAAAGAGELGLAGLRLGSDEIFDATARRQITERLADLDDEIAEAESWADPYRAERAREEKDALLQELASAAGLAGRPRRLGDQSERARKTVTARIRDIIDRIEQVHPALGAHLRASVTTGTQCAYSPATPVSWRVTSGT